MESELFDLGNHAVYIWSVYGVAAVVLGGLLIASLQGMRRREAVLASLRAEARETRDKG